MGKKTLRRVPRVLTRRTLNGGGRIENVTKIVNETPITEDMLAILNDRNKFVVATYWWGEKNVNKNLQLPCFEEIIKVAKKKVIGEYWVAGKVPELLKKSVSDTLAILSTRTLTPIEVAMQKVTSKLWEKWKKGLEEDKAYKERLGIVYAEMLQEAREKANAETNRFEKENKAILLEPVGKPFGPGALMRVLQTPEAKKLRQIVQYKRARAKDRMFPEMIEEWKQFCTAAKVNHLALHTEFGSDYQVGINAKPVFIAKMLDYLKKIDPVNPMGVLYIDGDMWVHRYPKLFELEDVDFMARGWNMDSRSQEGSLKAPYYDPMIFETSGGTMFFGNTEGARRLLKKWETESNSRPGKADDRILSQLFTTFSMVTNVNIVNLPIEYLWLTDLYATFLNETADPAVTGGITIKDALIEHPYCLTGEDRAGELSASKTSRMPEGYEEEIVEAINYKKPSDLIYEYITFNGHKEIRDELGNYMEFITRIGFHSKVPMATVIPFDDRYGEYDEIATVNETGLPAQVPPTGETVSITSGLIKEILTALRSGKNVWTGAGAGGPPELSYPDIECYATDASTYADKADWYTRYIQVATDQPMFFSARSPILQHLLLMCESLTDMNKHLKNSYTFLSRIRWETVKPKPPAKKSFLDASESKICSAEFPKVVNQIWFGPDPPGWRTVLFEKNRALCEKYGYTYKLWIETDRTSENFPITFPYQEVSRAQMRIAPGSQSRWAQIADLARLEIVYTIGGIYADSIIELSPALLLAVEIAMKQGYRFVGCNEDPCDPFGSDGTLPRCEGNAGRSYLTNSFFATTRGINLLARLLDPEVLNTIDFKDPNINRTTGPYFLRTMIKNPKDDGVFLFQSDQVFQYRAQETPYNKVAIDPFIKSEEVPGSVKVKDGQYFLPGGIEVLQEAKLRELNPSRAPGAPSGYDDYELIVKNKGPLAIYHSGLGGTWSVG